MIFFFLIFGLSGLLHNKDAAAVTSVLERPSVFKNHKLTEFQHSKFSKSQRAVHVTMSEVLDNIDEDA